MWWGNFPVINLFISELGQNWDISNLGYSLLCYTMVTFGSHGCWCACVSPEHDLIRKSKWVIVQLEVTNWILPIIKGYEIAWGWNELINFLFLLYIPPYVEHEQEETFNYGIERNKLLDTRRYCSFQGTKYSLISILARAKSCYNPYGSYFQRTEKGGEWVSIL